MTNPFALDNAPQAPTPAQPAAQPQAPVPAPATNPFGQQTEVSGGGAPYPPVGPPAAGDDPFSQPAPQRPRGPRLREMYGRLLIVIPHKLEEAIPNRLGKPGDTQDRLTADVVILNGGPIHFGGRPEKQPPIPHDQVAEVPMKVDRMFISAAGLISQCREALAKKTTQGRPGMVLGRLDVGEAKGDQNPPYLIRPYTPEEHQLAMQYLATVDPFA